MGVTVSEVEFYCDDCDEYVTQSGLNWSTWPSQAQKLPPCPNACASCGECHVECYTCHSCDCDDPNNPCDSCNDCDCDGDCEDDEDEDEPWLPGETGTVPSLPTAEQLIMAQMLDRLGQHRDAEQLRLAQRYVVANAPVPSLPDDPYKHLRPPA